MIKVNALIDLFFKESPFPERVPKIAECGYSYIETWGGSDPAMLKSLADAGKNSGVELVSIVMNFATQDDVAPIRAECRDAFVEQMDRFSDNALAAGCHSGIVTTGQAVSRRNHQEQRIALVDALAAAGEKLLSKDFVLNLEVLNTEVDHPGYFLDDPDIGVAVVKEVDLKNVRLLYDIYHMEIMRGNQVVFIESNIDWIGHFHSAGVPGRHELFNGETNYPFIVDRIEKAGYDGYFGLEYMPELESEESLKKTLQYLTGADGE